MATKSKVTVPPVIKVGGSAESLSMNFMPAGSTKWIKQDPRPEQKAPC